MKIHNHLPLLISCLEQWKTPPTRRQFEQDYALPLSQSLGDFFDDYHDVLEHLPWQQYRAHALQIDSQDIEERFRSHQAAVESLFGIPLAGEAHLLGTFHGMDGYARFERGTHEVFLGVDENFHRGYLDILMVHELTHVARESRPEVWQGFGLDPRMTNEEFREHQPVIEHLFGEGFSCAVSELLVPGEPAWDYVYQTPDSIEEIHRHRRQIERLIHAELLREDGDYGNLYSIQPTYAHYCWAMQWVKTLLREEGHGNPRELLSRCSKEFIEHALAFRI
jgi:hypothetical protein